MKTSVIIIAVSQYYGNLINLPGTLNSAKRFADWAVKHGGVAADNILEITDSGDDPVTIRRVEQEVSDFLSSRTIDRLIIYFAGHGVTSTMQQTWLLSEAERRNNEAINVADFADSLRFANIGQNNRSIKVGQIIIIADACRNNRDNATLYYGSAVYHENHPQTKRIRQDSFFSTCKDDVSLHITPTSSPPFCLFSEMMLNALFGHETDALTDEQSDWTVPNYKLADFLEKDFPKVAAAYNKGQAIQPDINTPIRPSDDPIYSKGKMPVTTQKVSLSRQAQADHMSFGQTTLFDENEFFSLGGAPLSRSTMYDPEIYYLMNEVEAPFIVVNRVRTENDLHFMQGNNLSPYRRRDISSNIDNFGAPAISRYMDGFKLIPHFPNSAVYMTYEDDVFLTSSERRGQNIKIDTIFSDEFNSRNSIYLNSKDAIRMGDELRYGKHKLPHRGVIAAYLYYNVGDHDNILRIAHYFARDGIQLLNRNTTFAVPFDIALLCASNIEWVRDGDKVRAFADFPDVPKDDFDSSRPSYSRSGFERIRTVPLWGQVPAFRQGWDRLRNRVFQYEIPDELKQISQDVRGDTLPTLGMEAAHILREFYGVRRYRD